MGDASFHPPLDFRSLKMLDECVNHFSSDLSYRYVQLPWMVGEEAYLHTSPDNARKGRKKCRVGGTNQYLVASGEQSFLQLEHQGLLPNTSDSFIGWTPCFRHENIYDETHHFYFMKAELFVRGEHLDQVCGDAYRFLSTYVPCIMVENGDTIDINGLTSSTELGSYGVRKDIDGNLYTFGTALALPRLGRERDLYLKRRANEEEFK